MYRISTFEDLAPALKRFEELFGAAEGSVEAGELREISKSLKSFEDQVAARIPAMRLANGALIDSLPRNCPSQLICPSGPIRAGAAAFRTYRQVQCRASEGCRHRAWSTTWLQSYRVRGDRR